MRIRSETWGTLQAHKPPPFLLTRTKVTEWKSLICFPGNAQDLVKGVVLVHSVRRAIIGSTFVARRAGR